MKLTRRDTLALLGGSATAAALGAPLFAESHSEGPVTHVVEMLNADPENKRERQVFVPNVVRAQPGDTIMFVATDRGHNAETNDKMIPDGGTEFAGKINEEFEIVMEVEGAYGYECKPHASAGMVGLNLVGDVSGNYEDLKKVRQRGKAKKRYEEIFAKADEILAAETA